MSEQPMSPEDKDWDGSVLQPKISIFSAKSLPNLNQITTSLTYQPIFFPVCVIVLTTLLKGRQAATTDEPKVNVDFSPSEMILMELLFNFSHLQKELSVLALERLSIEIQHKRNNQPISVQQPIPQQWNVDNRCTKQIKYFKCNRILVSRI